MCCPFGSAGKRTLWLLVLTARLFLNRYQCQSHVALAFLANLWVVRANKDDSRSNKSLRCSISSRLSNSSKRRFLEVGGSAVVGLATDSPTLAPPPTGTPSSTFLQSRSPPLLRPRRDRTARVRQRGPGCRAPAGEAAAHKSYARGRSTAWTAARGTAGGPIRQTPTEQDAPSAK